MFAPKRPFLSFPACSISMQRDAFIIDVYNNIPRAKIIENSVYHHCLCVTPSPRLLSSRVRRFPENTHEFTTCRGVSPSRNAATELADIFRIRFFP